MATPEKSTPRYFNAVQAIIKGIKAGSMTFVLPDGRRFESRGAAPGPDGEIVVRNNDLFGRIIRDGDLGFAEAYMDGWWDTPDLQALLDVLLLSNETVGRTMPGMAIVRFYERARHWLRANTKTQAAKNISYHYDLGNEFYSRWLDPSMTYSSAIFETGQEDMTAAQAKKYESICSMIDAQDGRHVLEIGCGWGGFAEHAAKHRGARVTGLTISREQHDFARERMFLEGLNEKVSIEMRDYRDETGRYDGIASIEMFEAVGEKYWPTYFSAVNDRLKPGGVAGLQIITVADHLFDSYRRSVDFIQKYIFPGGMLPSIQALGQQVSKAGLNQTDLLRFGDSYSETLRRWRADFNDAWDDIRSAQFDERFKRMWNFYLASCAACFRAETTDVVQIGLRRPA